MTNPIKVDVWSDVACPWCFIGKRKLEAGIEQFGGDVEVEFHSFELSPDTPDDFVGSTVEFLSERKGMPVDQVKQMLERVTGIAASVGLSFDFDAVKHTKTLRAHELLHFAKSQGKQLELKERLMSAYFEQGRVVSDVDELVTLAAEVGLDAGEARTALTNRTFGDAVQADIAQAREYGIQGVPFFVVNGKYGISGAQEASTFAAALEQVRDEEAAA